MKLLNVKMLLVALMLVFTGVLVDASPMVVHAQQPSSSEKADDSIGYSPDLNIDIDASGKVTGTTGKDGKDGPAGTIATGQKGISILKLIFNIITGGAVVVVSIILIIHAVSLARNGDNPSEKQKAVNGLINTVVAAALIGAAAIVISLGFNLFRK